MICIICERPKRYIWCPCEKANKLLEVDIVNWMYLKKCPACNSLWVGVPYEPHASFDYYVFWDKNKIIWEKEINKEEGKSLHKWHHTQLIRYRDTLTDEDNKTIMRHRERGYGHCDPYSQID